MSNVPGLALYQYVGCIYCARVRVRQWTALGVEIELRDTRRNSEFAEDVLTATGRPTVPVLRIETRRRRRFSGCLNPETSSSYLQSRFRIEIRVDESGFQS